MAVMSLLMRCLALVGTCTIWRAHAFTHHVQLRPHVASCTRTTKSSAWQMRASNFGADVEAALNAKFGTQQVRAGCVHATAKLVVLEQEANTSADVAVQAARVVGAWTRMRRGDPFEQDWPEKGLQQAASYIEGLLAEPWHDIAATDLFTWAAALEQHAPEITAELQAAFAQKDLEEKGTNVWQQQHERMHSPMAQIGARWCLWIGFGTQ